MLNKLIPLARHFFPRLEEWVMGAVPTGFAYEGTIKDHLGLQGVMLGLCITALVIVFAFILSANRVHKRRKALSEILATGYHINFVDRLDRALDKQPHLSYQGTTLPIAHVELTLPRTVQELREFDERMSTQKAAGVWKDGHYGERTVVFEQRGAVAVLIDLPRTLLSLNEYLDQDGDTNADGDVPRRYYKWFRVRLLAVRKKRPTLYKKIHYVDLRGERID